MESALSDLLAVVKEWSELPTAVQCALFSKVTAQTGGSSAQLKLLIARFLHDHKSVSTTETIELDGYGLVLLCRHH